MCVTATSTSQTRIPPCGQHKHQKSLNWGKSGIYETDFAAPFPAPHLRVQERIRSPTGDLAKKPRIGSAEALTNGPVKSKAQLAYFGLAPASVISCRAPAIAMSVPVGGRGAGGGRG